MENLLKIQIAGETKYLLKISPTANLYKIFDTEKSAIKWKQKFDENNNIGKSVISKVVQF